MKDERTEETVPLSISGPPHILLNIIKLSRSFRKLSMKNSRLASSTKGALPRERPFQNRLEHTLGHLLFHIDLLSLLRSALCCLYGFQGLKRISDFALLL
jgi:hypothetical protein